MATCNIDALPESLFGSPCSLLLRDGKCPEHGDQPQPAEFFHAEPSPQRVATTLSVLFDTLSKT